MKYLWPYEHYFYDRGMRTSTVLPPARSELMKALLLWNNKCFDTVDARYKHEDLN
jgi:hypothetical protein